MITTEIKRRERGEEELKVERIYNSLILLESLYKGRRGWEVEVPKYEEIDGGELNIRAFNNVTRQNTCVICGRFQIFRPALTLIIILNYHATRPTPDEKEYQLWVLEKQIEQRLQRRLDLCAWEWFSVHMCGLKATMNLE